MSPDEIAAILDEPQLKRLSGAILALDLKYVAAAQEAPSAIRALAARVRELETALRGLREAAFNIWKRDSVGTEAWTILGRAIPKADAALAPTRRPA